MNSTAPVLDAPPSLLRRLESLCRGRELGSLTRRLAALADLVALDLDRFESELPVTLRPNATAVERSANHLVRLGGKRLRPICVALAARLGSGFDERGLQVAVAVEMVHSATLLHDDVVDLGDTRRGAPASRLIYGNAVSIFAGDWLLVDALRRVRSTELPDVLARLLDVIEEMIFAESVQLEQRGRLDTTAERWLEVVDGKTAALFRWAMFAGGRCGGLEKPAALERYGRHLGIAFQAIDDLLDLDGDPSETGKALFADLVEGKLTYPLIVACERDSSLRQHLAQTLAGRTSLDAETLNEIRGRVETVGGLDECRALALDHAALAKEALLELPAGPARDALATIADATVHRPR